MQIFLNARLPNQLEAGKSPENIVKSQVILFRTKKPLRHEDRVKNLH